MNLIPLNPTDGFGGHAPPGPSLRAFADRVRSHGVTATVRRNRGTDIDAACGQLRSRAAIPSRSAAIGHNGTVNQWKWVNQFQPQTLYMATILCYVDAVFGLLFGGFATPIGLLVIAALGAGGFGIANEKRWGYAVAVDRCRRCRC